MGNFNYRLIVEAYVYQKTLTKEQVIERAIARNNWERILAKESPSPLNREYALSAKKEQSIWARK